MKRKTYLIPLLSLLLLVGCGSQTDEQEPTTLVVAQGADAVSFDPHATNDAASNLVIAQIFETLVFMNEDLELVPGLAKSWEAIDDRTYEFVLQDNVYFHNGELLTAFDVEFTLLRALESSVVTAFLGQLDPEGIEVIDDHTIRISTLEPFAPLLSHLSHTTMSILSETAITEYGDEAGRNPIGTGKFEFTNWISGDQINLVKNENYDGELPVVDNLTVRIIPDPANRLIELETGQVHIALDISPSDLDRIEAHDDFELLRSPSLRTNYLGFNVQNEPFDNVLVRQAISHAIDTELIINTILEGVGSVANGPINSNIFGAHPDLENYEFNTERAKELLAEAGYPNGFSTVLSIDNNPVRVNIATAIANQLETIGIHAEIQSNDWASYLESTANGENAMFILGWTTVTADGDIGLFPTFHSSQAGASGNRSFYANERVDELLELARATQDSEQREAFYFEAQEIILEEAPWVFLDVPEVLLAVHEDVNGFNLHPTTLHRFGGVYLEK